MYRIARIEKGKPPAYYKLGTIKGKRIGFVQYGSAEEAKVVPALECAILVMSYLRGDKRKVDFQIERLNGDFWQVLDRTKIV